MTIRLLGPFEVQLGEQSVTVGSAKQRALLALLALNVGRVVTVDRLIEGLWGDSASPETLNALQHHISRLRKLVSPCLLTRPPGYVLDLPSAEVDALRFAELVREARVALQRGDVADARALFRAAFLLWRGSPLLEFVDHDWARQEAARLENLYLDAIEDRIDADLAARSSAELVDELRALTAEHRFRERLWGQLMLALYRAGRQTDALATYQQARQVLAEEHGVDPGPELVRLEAAILAHDPDLMVPSRTPVSAPRGASKPAAPLTSSRPGGLPLSLMSFIGRHEQMPALRSLLATSRLITLTGPPGVGKTRLALELGRAVQHDFADRVWLVELARLSNESVLSETLAGLMGIGRAASSTTAGELDQLIDQLRTHRALLILDNCEHVLATVSGVVESLLAGCPELHVLATSREPLGIPGEAQQPVRPLSLARPGTREPRELLGSEAVRLFEDRAVKVRPGFAVTAETATAVDDICRQLDGLPLAIELAAARVNVLPVEHIARALRDRFRLLVAGPRTAPQRQQTLRAAIDWSYELLGDDERRVFEELSIFAGGCSLASAEAIGVRLNLGAFEMLDVLARLVDKSVVVATTGSNGQPRYHLLETLRAYGLERLVERGGYDAARHRHGELMATVAEQAERDLRGSQRTSCLQLLVDELDNFRTVLQNASGGADAELAIRLAGALGFFFSTANRVGEGRYWLEDALAHADGSVPNSVLSRAYTYYGPMLVQYGDFESAVAAAERGLAYAQAAGDAWQIAYARTTLALTLDASGRFGQAPELLVQARAEFAGIDEPRGHWGVAQCEFVTGLAAVRTRNIEAVDRAARELETRALRIHYDLFEGWAHLMAGWVAERRADAQRAETAYARVLVLTQALGIAGHVAFAMANLGRLIAATDDLERARLLQTDAVALTDDGVAPWFAAYAHMNLAVTLLRMGEAASAERLLRQAIGECPVSGSPFSQERFFSLFGGSPAARAQMMLSTLVRERGSPAQADELLMEALAIAERERDAECVVMGIQASAAAAARASDLTRAARLLAAASTLHDRVHSPRDPFAEASADGLLSLLAAHVEASDLARLSREGSALTFDEALRLAREPSLRLVN